MDVRNHQAGHHANNRQRLRSAWPKEKLLKFFPKGRVFWFDCVRARPRIDGQGFTSMLDRLGSGTDSDLADGSGAFGIGSIMDSGNRTKN